MLARSSTASIRGLGRSFTRLTLPSQTMTEPKDDEPALEPAPEDLRTTKPAGLGGRAAAMVGTAMLGLEHAMRREPPAEVIVREHQPERGLSGADPDLVLEFPDDV